MLSWLLATNHGYIAVVSATPCNQGIVLCWNIHPSCWGVAPWQPMNITSSAKLSLQMTSCVTEFCKSLQSPGYASVYPWQLLKAECNAWQVQLTASGLIPELSTVKCHFKCE